MSAPNPPKPAAPSDPNAGLKKYLGITVGAIVCVVLADYYPTLINSGLALILAGIVLKQSSKWTPILQAATAGLG